MAKKKATTKRLRPGLQATKKATTKKKATTAAAPAIKATTKTTTKPRQLEPGDFVRTLGHIPAVQLNPINGRLTWHDDVNDDQGFGEVRYVILAKGCRLEYMSSYLNKERERTGLPTPILVYDEDHRPYLVSPDQVELIEDRDE